MLSPEWQHSKEGRGTAIDSTETQLAEHECSSRGQGARARSMSKDIGGPQRGSMAVTDVNRDMQTEI
jgi:hypothetical protein